MKNKLRIITAVALAVLLFTPAISNAEKGTVELLTKAEKQVLVTNDKGERELRLVDASKAKVIPGEVVLFTTQYTNKGTDPAEKVVITNKVPRHMLYTEESALGANTRVTFSIDNGKSFAAPEKLFVKDTDGKKRLARASDYTHIRWVVTKNVLPGSSGKVEFKALLE